MSTTDQQKYLKALGRVNRRVAEALRRAAGDVPEACHLLTIWRRQDRQLAEDLLKVAVPMMVEAAAHPPVT